MRLILGFALIVVCARASGAGGPGACPYSPYSRTGKIKIASADTGWHVSHVGSSDWALTGKGLDVRVVPGDLYRLSCPVLSRIAGTRISMSVVLRDSAGRVLSWEYAAQSLSGGITASRSFVVPPRVATMCARIVGVGEAEIDVGALRLERIGRIESAQGLPEVFALKSSALRLSVNRDDLSLSVTDERTGRTWAPHVQALSGYFVRTASMEDHRLRLGVTDVVSQGEVSIVYELSRHTPYEFTVTVDGSGVTDGFAYPNPFKSEKGDWLVLPQSEGFRLPMCEKTFTVWNTQMWASYGCMAFFGVEDAQGAGWMAIAETRNDASVNILKRDDGTPIAVGPYWMPERGKYGYPRTVRYVFLDRGGYVAMAKRYRQAAKAAGLIKTFREKAKERPIVDRLLGAANIWYSGYCGLSPEKMAREMVDAGIDRLLWSTLGISSNQVATISAMPGALVGRYDVYRDVYTPELIEHLGWKRRSEGDVCRNTLAWPNDVIWNTPDSNDVRKAWGLECRDRKVRHCAAQCTLCQPACARRHLTYDLQRVPYTSRFVDVTTAVGAEECENPRHPATRTQSRAAICELLGLMCREFNLVVGSEQGVDFAVPVCDYFEGMLSPSECRMPHGRKGADRAEIFREGLYPTNVSSTAISRVENYGLGERYRIPLFELVYHDCCCAHWYWYDYSNRPIYLWRKRDLFNVLYGTAPMYIFDYRLWKERKEMFVNSYRMVGPVARQTGYSEMTDHRMVTDDGRIQCSAFSDGTHVAVNFGDCPYRLENGRTLPPMSHCVWHE